MIGTAAPPPPPLSGISARSAQSPGGPAHGGRMGSEGPAPGPTGTPNAATERLPSSAGDCSFAHAMSVSPPESKPLIMTPHEALKRHFGFDGFLDGQEEVIRDITTGKDGLVVMPTGGGKSLCYQVPALCFGGVTLVISPLIALMKDQVDALVARGIGATMINSTIP